MDQSSSENRPFRFSEHVSINVECHGFGSRPLLCLHGFGASLESWRDIQPLLSRDHRVYLIDLKGFGLSSKPGDGKYSVEDQAEIVTTFIEQEGLSNLTIIGHSYGGAVALLAYFMLVDRGLGTRVASLVLLDSAGYVQKLPFFVMIPRIPLINRLVLDCIPSRWQASFTLRHLFFDSSKVTSERVQRYARFLRLQCSVDALIACARQLIPPDPTATISRMVHMRLATLIVWGQNDPAISVEYAYRFHQDISGSRLEVIPRCGHVPHEEYPVETSQIILDFCK
jgi:pimeloyl-ACP methyl ester carboxylesterase